MVTNKSARAQIISSVIAGVLSIVAAVVTAWLSSVVSADRRALTDAQAEVNYLKGLLTNATTYAKERALATQTEPMQEGPRKNGRLGKAPKQSHTSTSPSTRPIASYEITQAIPFAYGAQTRLNFDKQLANSGVQVQTGPYWALTVPRDGFYAITVSAQTDLIANIQLSVKGPQGPILATPPITDPRNGITQLSTTDIVRLTKGQTLWVEASHSMHAHNIIGGKFSLVFLQAQ